MGATKCGVAPMGRSYKSGPQTHNRLRHGGIRFTVVRPTPIPYPHPNDL
jgi:hypothetical protein